MKTTFSFISLPLTMVLLMGCNDQNNVTPTGAWDNNVFIINEGPFKTGSGSVSAFNRESMEVTNDLFEKANGRPLGNIVQSMTVHHDKAFIVVNNSNKIEVVNLADFKSVATIENLKLPRYFIGFDDKKGYVSCWDSTVKVINLKDYSIITSVQTGTNPDKMIVAGDRLFILNTGGYGTDSPVSVIRTDDEELLVRLKVGDRPSGIQMDFNGHLWILCSGKGWNGSPAPGDTQAKLVCLDPDSYEIIREIPFPDSVNHPENLVIDENGTTLYYNHPAGIFALSVYDTALKTLPFITGNKMFYGLGYDKTTKMIMATDPLDYSQNGWVYRFNALDGMPVDSFMVGIIPNGFWFN